jgi:hypothetical protein
MRLSLLFLVAICLAVNWVIPATAATSASRSAVFDGNVVSVYYYRGGYYPYHYHGRYYGHRSYYHGRWRYY